jgi:hypothetical protein
MIPPAGMAIAAMTVMLWILWSDSVRPRRSSQIVFAMRIALYLIVGAVLVLNRIRYPFLFSGGATGLVIAAACVSLFGAAYFARKLVRRA